MQRSSPQAATRRAAEREPHTFATHDRSPSQSEPLPWTKFAVNTPKVDKYFGEYAETPSQLDKYCGKYENLDKNAC